uniref:Ig-like domain-containing protein n=1 Tax=Hucho hucho TaxID=62062 RepID=A0A4W5MM18_9TELE
MGESNSYTQLFTFCVQCSVEHTQPNSLNVKPGETLTISCSAGKPMECFFYIWGGGSFYQNDALKNKLIFRKDMSSSTSTLTGQNLQTEDTAVYYCDLYKNLYPTVSLLLAPIGSTQYLMCMIEDFTPKKVTVTWKKNVKKVEGPTPTVGLQTSGLFSASSLLKVKNTDWNNKVKYICVVQHQEQTITKTISKTGLYIGVD